ncbi:MAG: hypothetical protein Unbinned200contig1000_22 [Prokaryotic dsDNA virus sp.]|jgi:hypothetical protein|nr:hypothetical protein [Flavobacteriaceae bacterium]QDP65282.1 MAG: hypothetical protein Unbinned200contig1000_22 [Prokaryotic dsDNA virus sp.]|tara:strand:+ start:29904 stop:31352 length:1449 start_codon:yes stop_codon:yes gene_type:complete
MPFSTGTANTPGELLSAINTLVTANGWTKISGETDQVPVSPKSARYWRLLWIENEDVNNDFRELNSIEFRSTLGGAAISGTWSTPGVASGAPPGYFRSADINDDVFWIKLDCGSPTIVRECVVQCQTDNESPRDFFIQWSNDDLTWTTMFGVNNLSWVDNETKTFQFDDGYLFSDHISSTQCVRAGYDVREVPVPILPYTDSFSQSCNDRFIWQAPGYDANRRIYIEARGHFNAATSTSFLEIGISPEYDSANPYLGQQIGGYGKVFHLFDVNPVTYWIYMNDTRLIVVTKSGTSDYTSSYIGFLAAFATPDDYPQPLFLSSTSNDLNFLSENNNRFSSMADPGDGCAAVRLWDNSWNILENRGDSSLANLYQRNITFWTWPFHVGSTFIGSWPNIVVGDYQTFDTHWLNQQDPTNQNDVPLYPVLVQNKTYGNIGALQGVFAVPGSTLAPEQVFAISGQNYRVFPNRTRREGCNWFVVREN